MSFHIGNMLLTLLIFILILLFLLGGIYCLVRFIKWAWYR